VRVLFATPAYWPATAFGGPTRAAKELGEGLVEAGWSVHVLTTSLRSVDEAPHSRFHTERTLVGGPVVTYLATPLRYRWMGITPTLPLALPWRDRPDVVHLFGYRDVVTTLTAAWARALHIPYVFEPLDMFVPRFRNVPMKEAFDRVIGEPVARAAKLIVACSEHEKRELVAAGLDAERIAVRPNGFPPPQTERSGPGLRERLGIGEHVPFVVNVGRLSFKKGLDLLVDAVAQLDGVHVALVGPDDGDGTRQALELQVQRLGLEDRVHFTGPLDTSRPLDVYGDADLFVLPSRNESFGIVAAEAAACGVPVVVTDRCGVAEVLGGAALVVACAPEPIRDAIARVLDDEQLRQELADAGPRMARAWSWRSLVERQIELYERAMGRHG